MGSGDACREHEAWGQTLALPNGCRMPSPSRLLRDGPHSCTVSPGLRKVCWPHVAFGASYYRRMEKGGSEERRDHQWIIIIFFKLAPSQDDLTLSERPHFSFLTVPSGLASPSHTPKHVFPS